MWAGDNFPWSPGSISGTHEQAKPGDKRLWSDPYHSGSDKAAFAHILRVCSYGLHPENQPPPTLRVVFHQEGDPHRPAVNADASLCASEQHRHPDTPVFFVLRTQASSKPDSATEHAGWPVSLRALGGN